METNELIKAMESGSVAIEPGVVKQPVQKAPRVVTLTVPQFSQATGEPAEPLVQNINIDDEIRKRDQMVQNKADLTQKITATNALIEKLEAALAEA